MSVTPLTDDSILSRRETSGPLMSLESCKTTDLSAGLYSRGGQRRASGEQTLLVQSFPHISAAAASILKRAFSRSFLMFPRELPRSF